MDFEYWVAMVLLCGVAVSVDESYVGKSFQVVWIHCVCLLGTLANEHITIPLSSEYSMS